MISTRTSLIQTAGTLCLFAALSACGAPPEPAPVVEAPPARPHVVLVTLDTVRADRIGSYGYEPAATPAVDALAARGIRFEHAYSPYPYTIPAHSSLMTGLYPPQHLVRDNGDNALGPEFETLAEVMKEAGYATGGSVAAFVTSRQWGFAQGFDGYFDEVPRATDFWHAYRPGSDVVDDALAWVETVPEEEPIFLWVHMYDAHMPLEPIEPFKSAHPDRPYDAEIAYVDAQLQRLVERFEGEDTLFVVTSDHGEANGDHDERAHGMYVYDATQRVPLVIAGPGVEAAVETQPVSLVDVMPTILALTGVDAPEGMAGRPVPSDEERPVYLESWQLANRFGFAPHVAVVQGDHKLINLPQPELYAMTADPGEATNLAGDQEALVAELKKALDAFGFEPPPKGQDAISTETAAELAALGYVVGVRPDAPIEDLPDPKDHADLLRELQLTSVRHQKDPEKAVAILRRLMERYPDIAELRVRLATFLTKAGKAKEAEAVITEGLKVATDVSKLHTALVPILMEQGRMAEAAALLYDMRELRGYSPRYRVQVVRALLGAGRAAEAETLAEEFMVEYPDDLEIVGTIGVHYARTGREAKAWPLLDKAVEAERPPADVSFALAMRAAAEGRADDSRALFEQELGHHPMNWRARSVLAGQARDGKDWAAWKEHAGHLTRIKGKDPASWRDHAQAAFNLQEYELARTSLDTGLLIAPKDPELVLLDANLMAKEDRREEGALRFEEAKKLHEAQKK